MLGFSVDLWPTDGSLEALHLRKSLGKPNMRGLRGAVDPRLQWLPNFFQRDR